MTITLLKTVVKYPLAIDLVKASAPVEYLYVPDNF